MRDPFEKVKGGRLTFKGGAIASLSKSIDKKKIKNKKNKGKDRQKSLSSDDASKFQPGDDDWSAAGSSEASVASKTPAGEGGGGGDTYTIDAVKRLKYEQLFPVEAKKFAYDPKSNVRSVEGALDDRVKKKADRYCK